jgi:hemoglobin-like flavoprotein
MLSLAFKSNNSSHLARTENVEALLLVDFATNVFLPHIQKELAVENVMFWREVLKLERMEADEIFNTYIAENAPSQVNVSNHVKQNISSRMEVGDDDGLHLVFSEAVLEIEQILAQGSFLRFLNGIMDDLHVSWSRVQERLPAEKFCEKFYEKLFKISPEMKGVFRNTRFRKDEMILMVIQIAVPLIAQLDQALPELLRIGRRHRSYKAQARNFAAMKLALIEAIDEVAELRESERASWGITFEIMAGTMQSRMQDDDSIVCWKVSKGKREERISKSNARKLAKSSSSPKLSIMDSNESQSEDDFKSGTGASPSSGSPGSQSRDSSSAHREMAKNLRNAEILFELDSRFSIFGDSSLKTQTSAFFKRSQLHFLKEVYGLRSQEKTAQAPRSELLIKAIVIYDDYLAKDAANMIEFKADNGKEVVEKVGLELKKMMKSDNSESPISAVYGACVKMLEKELAEGPVIQYFKHNTEILATSWIKLREKSTSKECSDLFYKHVFKIDSELAPLFSKSSFTHEEMVLSVVDLIVPLLNDLEGAISTLVRLGERHRRYGATLNRMETMGKAMIMTLKKVLAKEWTEEIEQAWSQSFKILSSILLKAMEDDELAQLEHDIIQGKVSSKCTIS